MLPVAILAGGLATRLRPLTEKVPKALLDVAGKPFVAHQLELLRSRGVRRVVLCLGYLGEQVEALIGDGRSFGVEAAYSYDGERLLGTGGALRRALPVLGDRFLVLYGDAYLECDYEDVARRFVESGHLGLMTVFRNAGRWDSSNVFFRDGRILKYNKTSRDAEMEHIDWGLGALSAEAFRSYGGDAPLDLATVYQDLLARGELAGYEVTRRFYEIGSANGLEEMRRLLTGRKIP
jgi:N-acetyl-alpha-D-muramate 1-phosphate uridylyltransferase